MSEPRGLELLSLIAFLCDDAKKWTQDRSFGYAASSLNNAQRAAEVYITLNSAVPPSSKEPA